LHGAAIAVRSSACCRGRNFSASTAGTQAFPIATRRAVCCRNSWLRPPCANSSRNSSALRCDLTTPAPLQAEHTIPSARIVVPSLSPLKERITIVRFPVPVQTSHAFSVCDIRR